MLAVAVLVGIVLPPLSSLLRPLLFPSIFFLMLLSLMQIDLRGLNRAHTPPAWQVSSIIAWQMVLLPLIVGCIHVFTPLPGAWTEIMFLTACASTIFGAPAFAQLIDLDAGLTLVGMIATSLVMPVSFPLLVIWILGTTGDFDFMNYVMRLLIFIVCPTGIAILYQGTVQIKTRRNHDSLLRYGTVLFLVVFALAIMDGIGERFATDTGAMIGLLGLAFGVHFLFFASTVLVFGWMNRDIRWTAGLLNGYRNLSLLLAVAGTLVPVDFIVFVALWQIPMFIMPLLTRRLLKAAR